MPPANLNPTELTVLEVVRRCAAAKLGPPNTSSIIQLSRCRASAVRIALLRLVEMGYLAGGGRGSRGYLPTDKAASSEGVAA